jgi:hypothetical protein
MSSLLMGSPATVETEAEVAPVVEGNTPITEGATTPSNFQDWEQALQGIDADLKEDPSLKAVGNFPELVKQFVNSQRMIGKDKFVVPDQHATNEDWRNNVWHKLGLPEKFDDYKVAAEGTANEEVLEGFRKAAYEANLLPGQMQAIYDFYSRYEGEQIEQVQESQQREIDEGISGLKTEWGEGFDRKVDAARNALNTFADDHDKEYLEKTGLGNNARLIRILANVGENLAEDTFKEEAKGAFGMTPDEAMNEANAIMADFNGAYYDKLHPNHKMLVQKVNKLISASSK